MSFQVVNIILSFLNLEMIMALKARPGRPGQLLDRLGDVPLLPLFLLFSKTSKGEGNQPLQLPLFALELVLVVAGCCVVHVDPAGFLVSQA